MLNVGTAMEDCKIGREMMIRGKSTLGGFRSEYLAVMKSLALASTVLSLALALALASALLGLGFCAVLGSRTRYF